MMDDNFFENLFQKVESTNKFIEELEKNEQDSTPKKLKIFLVLLFFMLLIGIAVGVNNNPSLQYDPLQYPYTARIQASTTVQNKPAIKQIDTVYVTQYKCNNENHDIQVESNVYWKIISPDKDLFTIQGTTGVYPREKGCKTYTISLKVPEEVYEKTNEIYKKNKVDIVTWEAVGIDSPIGKSNPVQKVWSTGEFVVLRSK